MRLMVLAILLMVGACATKPEIPGAREQVSKACAQAIFDAERSACIEIGMLVFQAIVVAPDGQKAMDNIFAVLRPYSPYGPTAEGWKGISPGRKPGGRGVASMADGVMRAVQLLGGIKAMQGGTHTQMEVAQAAGFGLRPAS